MPGTTERVVVPILEAASGKKAGVDFGVGMNPEFLTEGEAVGDFMEPDRIVLGGIDVRSQDALAELYTSFTGVPMVRTNPSTAEMIKYSSNALLATMVSFSNELANLSSAVGDIDIVEVMHGVHASRYLTPEGGPGSSTAGRDQLIPDGRLRFRRQLPAEGRQRPGRARSGARGPMRAAHQCPRGQRASAG